MTRDQAWSQIIGSSLIDLSQPVNRIASADFKALGQEPRLMTKFDARGSRPQSLRDNGLFLLPETNGSYLLLKEDGYCDLPTPKNSEVESVDAQFPFPLVSLRDATSEMSQLDRLFQCGLIQEVVKPKKDKIFATIRGRRFAPHFDYYVGRLGQFSARGIQYEVDQGYETEDEIVLFEAKNTTPDNFLIRQLYFPYRVYLNRFGKKVRNFFFNYNAVSGLHSFYECTFEDPNQYRSIKFTSSRHFRVRFPDVEKPKTLGDWLNKVPFVASPALWEIPQADDFSKIIEFPLQVAAGHNDSGLIASAFDFVERQSSYYRRASEQMGLIRSENGRYCLTNEGQQYTELSASERQEQMITMLLQQPVVRHAIENALRTSSLQINLSDIEDSIAQNSALSGQTVHRRAQTVRCWLRWLETSLGQLNIGGKALRVN